MKFKRLLIITDTLITKIDGEWFIFNSVANEINVFNELFQRISIIGVFKCNEQLKDEIKQFERLKIQSEPLFFREISRENPIYLNFFNIISNVYQLITLVPKFSKIHVRGPGIPMFISLFFCVFFPWKKWWFKFANTWNTNTKSEFWNFQKKLLKSFFWIKVTVNGRNSSDPEHIINFENPTLIRTKPNSILKKNTTSVLTFIFAGRLTEEKGVVLAARGLVELANTKGNLSFKLIIAGNGPEQSILEKMKDSSAVKIQILGAVSKDNLIRLFEESKFLVLPTLSPEGFPKVVAEAMSCGCIPIVTNISSIPVYIKDGFNGFLLDHAGDLYFELLNLYDKIISLNNCEMLIIQRNAQNTAYDYFTYERFKIRLESEIFN